MTLHVDNLLEAETQSRHSGIEGGSVQCYSVDRVRFPTFESVR